MYLLHNLNLWQLCWIALNCKGAPNKVFSECRIRMECVAHNPHTISHFVPKPLSKNVYMHTRIPLYLD